MIAYLKLRIAILTNRLRRFRGPALRDQIAKLIMSVCTLQLERGESKELAPTPGATGPMVLSGGAITTVTYRVFDKHADKVDKLIRQEPWRAFATVTMILSIDKDPEFTVKVSDAEVEPNATHKAPGLELIAHLANYFPLLPKPYAGPVYNPEVAS